MQMSRVFINSFKKIPLQLSLQELNQSRV